MERFQGNPLIRPEDVAPSREGLEVVGTFNPGAFEFGGRIGLLVRVAERPTSGDADAVAVPIFDTTTQPPAIETIRLRRDDPDWDFSDPRVVLARPSGNALHHYLTSVSHLRLAWSDDGRWFTVGDPGEGLWPESPQERFGVEDARVTRIDGGYLVTYTAVGDGGVCVGLAGTTDFRKYKRFGVILPPENKDACVFPEKIGGEYVMLHRPAGSWCRPGVWLSRSRDLVSWGRHELVAAPRPGEWDSLRIGAGPPPVRVADGWLLIYHGAGARGYCLGAMLLNAENPARVIARSRKPIMTPEAPYETAGFFQNVAFSNGLVERPGGEFWLYYGGADRVTAGCCVGIGEIESSWS